MLSVERVLLMGGRPEVVPSVVVPIPILVVYLRRQIASHQAELQAVVLNGADRQELLGHINVSIATLVGCELNDLP
jgi:hypothetical protein